MARGLLRRRLRATKSRLSLERGSSAPTTPTSSRCARSPGDGSRERAEASDVLRQLYPRVLARTLGLTRPWPTRKTRSTTLSSVLEDLARGGTPDSPEAWLVTVAANLIATGSVADGARSCTKTRSKDSRR